MPKNVIREEADGKDPEIMLSHWSSKTVCHNYPVSIRKNFPSTFKRTILDSKVTS